MPRHHKKILAKLLCYYKVNFLNMKVIFDDDNGRSRSKGSPIKKTV